jgi:hypothetical protein
MSFSSGQEVLLYFRQKKNRVFLGGLAGGIIYILFVTFYPKKYEANTIIYSASKNKTETVQLSEVNSLQNLNESYTIINWVYSTQLINHLILKFDLFNHYNVNTLKTDAYSKCFNKITQAINVYLTPYGAVRINVKDKNRFVAAKIANEILLQVDKLNKLKIVENRKLAIREYEFLLKEFSADVVSQRDSIKNIINSFSKLAKENKIDYEKTEITINSLSNASLNYERLSNDWLTLRKVHLLSLKDIEKFNLPNFIILQYALPEAVESPFSLENIGLFILSFLLGIWLTAAILLLNYKYSASLKLVFGRTYHGNGNGVGEITNTHKISKPKPETVE